MEFPRTSHIVSTVKVFSTEFEDGEDLVARNPLLDRREHTAKGKMSTTQNTNNFCSTRP